MTLEELNIIAHRANKLWEVAKKAEDTYREALAEFRKAIREDPKLKEEYYSQHIGNKK